MIKPSFIFLLSLITTFSFSQTRPNIVLFMADDMAWNDCGAYGSTQVKTPNIDQLASEGMRFDNMFTSSAMCAPTRQQLLTGLWPVRNGAHPNHSYVYNSVKTIPAYLQELGYRTALAGKDHIGPESAFPFERIAIKVSEEGAFDKMEEFIQRDKTQPFFLLVTSDEPHVPWTKGDPSQYNPKTLAVPNYLIDTEETRETLSKYYAEISYMDDEVGRCLKLVKEAETIENTIFIFTSEQGPQLPFGKWTCYDHGLKTSFIVRWPGRVKPGSSNEALAQYVDVVPTLLEAVGGETSQNTGTQDTYGNVGFDGESMMDLLTGVSSTHRKYTYGVHTTRGILDGSETYPIRSVRSDHYLYIRNLSFESKFSNVITVRHRTELLDAWYDTGKKNENAASRAKLYEERPYEELFDIRSDPDLLTNLAEDANHAIIKEQLADELDQWMLQQGDLGVATEMEAIKRQKNYILKHPASNFKD